MRQPAGPGWPHEDKHDGFDILDLKQRERDTLCSRRSADFTDRFSRITEAVRGLSADEALIDGEAVVFQDDGRSDFAGDSVPTCQKRRVGPELLALVGEPSAV